METFTPSNAGPLALSYSAPQDGDNNGGPPKVADVRPMMEGIAHDLAYVVNGNGTVFTGRKEFQGRVEFEVGAEFFPATRVQEIPEITVDTELLDIETDEILIRGIGAVRTLTIPHPTLAMVNRRLRISLTSESTAESASLTIATPAGTIVTMPNPNDPSSMRWIDLTARSFTGPTRYRWTLTAGDSETIATVGAEAWGAS